MVLLNLWDGILMAKPPTKIKILTGKHKGKIVPAWLDYYGSIDKRMVYKFRVQE